MVKRRKSHVLILLIEIMRILNSREKHVPSYWTVILINNYNLFLSLNFCKFVNDFVKTELILISDLSIYFHSSVIREHFCFILILENFLHIKQQIGSVKRIRLGEIHKIPFHIRFNK